MEGLQLQYPVWFIIFCLFLGLAYALSLYYRDKTFREQPFWLSWLLGILRFSIVGFLAFLLLSPFLKSIQTRSQKPLIIFAQDNSQSVLAEFTPEQKADYQASIEKLRSDLGSTYDLHAFSFGDVVKEQLDFNFEDKITNISECIEAIFDRYSNQNLGALIIASDGIYNEGSNPVYMSTRFNAPLYTIALGDTTPQKDVILKRVLHNKIAYLGDKFTIQVDIAAQNCEGMNTLLKVEKIKGENSETVAQKSILIDKVSYFETEELILDATESGVNRYIITLNPVNGEVSLENNKRDIYIDVLDARQKILILANAPHPDISAIRQSLDKNKNYQVTLNYADKLEEDVTKFDFVIFHQIPSLTQDANSVFTTVQSRKIPHFFILGNQSNILKFNRLQDILSISAPSPNTNEVQAHVSKDFVAFTTSNDLKNEIQTFAPLLAPFGEFFAAANSQVLLYQRIGKIDTQYPLLAMGQDNGTRIGVLCAEGIWKWRLFDFLQNNNQDIFEELLGKVIQYLSVKEDKRKFRVSLDKTIYAENEEIIFDAQLYNDNYELVNDPDVSLVISGGKGNNYNFNFNRTENAYRLSAGILAEGNYSFEATTFSNGEEFKYNGQFSVQPIQLEMYETTANHNLLKLLSEKYGGEMIYPDQINDITSILKNKETIKPVLYQTSRTQPLINIKWVFYLLLFILTLEWFLRRYFGGY